MPLRDQLLDVLTESVSSTSGEDRGARRNRATRPANSRLRSVNARAKAGLSCLQKERNSNSCTSSWEFIAAALRSCAECAPFHPQKTSRFVRFPQPGIVRWPRHRLAWETTPLFSKRVCRVGEQRCAKTQRTPVQTPRPKEIQVAHRTEGEGCFQGRNFGV